MKLKSITLHNYRGYIHETIDFTDGLNTITGIGGAGKSAVRKGIEFVTKNEQGGHIFSYWIVDDKGKIIKGESCWVEIHTTDGDIVRRERTRDDNFYVINGGPPIRNFSQGVPDDVKAIFNLEDVNLQSQFEPHFMLNDSASAVAKTLNKNGGLENIDTSIAANKKLRGKIKKAKDASDANLKTYEKNLAEFAFIDDMEKDVNELIVLESDRDGILKKHSELNTQFELIRDTTTALATINDVMCHKEEVVAILKLYEKVVEERESNENLSEVGQVIHDLKTSLENIDKMVRHKNVVAEILSLYADKSVETKRYNTLLDSVEKIEGLEESLKSYTDLNKYKGLVADILTLYSDLEKEKKNNTDMENKFNSICTYEKDIKTIDKELKELYAKLEGQNCPICGSKIKKEEVC